MNDLDYVRAHSLTEAVALLNQPGIKNQLLAGGTDLMVQIRRGEVQHKRLVDITHLTELKVVQVPEKPEGSLLLGAGVTIAEILENSALVSRLPLLAQACAAFGSPQIRNLATLGGNVINQAACADILPILVCLEAVAYVVSPQGEYCVPVEDLVTQALPTGRILRAFAVPQPPAGSRSVTLRLARRRALAAARLSLTVLGRVNSAGLIEEARLVPGAVFAWAQRIPAVEGMLIGHSPSAALFEAAGQKLVELLQASSGNRWSLPYKQVVISRFTERVLAEVYGN
jgi:CO/xanthine dehydrogenase FAD-binding subunit